MTAIEILEQAKKSIPTMKPSDPLYDDMLSEAVLALLEGRDPYVAAMTFRETEMAWRLWSRGLHAAPPPGRKELVMEH
jgi:hypothetical protein